MFEEIEDQLEEKAKPQSDEAKLIALEAEKRALWLQKRSKCIVTASQLPKLMTGGRGSDWGDTSKAVLYAAKYCKRTSLQLEEKDLYNFRWGHEQEPNAIEWLRANCMEEIKSCSTDFDEIVFNQPFDGFGDSPDFYAGSIVGEIKCPVDQAKFEMCLDIDRIDDKHENYWQLLGHFIGSPESNELWLVYFDGYNQDGHIVKMYRKDHEANIQKLTSRIKDAIYVVNYCLEKGEKIGNVETILNSRV